MKKEFIAIWEWLKKGQKETGLSGIARTQLDGSAGPIASSEHGEGRRLIWRGREVKEAGASSRAGEERVLPGKMVRDSQSLSWMLFSLKGSDGSREDGGKWHRPQRKRAENQSGKAAAENRKLTPLPTPSSLLWEREPQVSECQVSGRKGDFRENRNWGGGRGDEVRKS